MFEIQPPEMAKMRQINESGADLPCAIGVCAVQYCLSATVNVGGASLT
jgi:hypothetical protein